MFLGEGGQTSGKQPENTDEISLLSIACLQLVGLVLNRGRLFPSGNQVTYELCKQGRMLL